MAVSSRKLDACTSTVVVQERKSNLATIRVCDSWLTVVIGVRVVVVVVVVVKVVIVPREVVRVGVGGATNWRCNGEAERESKDSLTS